MSDAQATLDRVESRQTALWINSAKLVRSADWYAEQHASVEDAKSRFARFAPVIARLFPETLVSNGFIRSQLVPVENDISSDCGLAERLFVKGDHDLPIVGSIKARGGFHAVLSIAEQIALSEGLLIEGNYQSLAEEAARVVFSRYRISVGSTGNLGLSIGTIASTLGFSVIVHMSTEAKHWKRRMLRDRGATVVEHEGDYEQALIAARTTSAQDPSCFFIDDEDSTSLLYGYAVAAEELESQLKAIDVEVDEDHPLIVYIPCGVGGAPTGIALGLHLIFGRNVHCFFAEPIESPCFTLQMLSDIGSRPSIYDHGLSGVTAADGLAVTRASLLAADIARTVVAGTYTVAETTMLQHLYLAASERLRLEPSAAAGMSGPTTLMERAREQTSSDGLPFRFDKSTHVVWTTGGRLIPDEEYEPLRERGREANPSWKGIS